MNPTNFSTGQRSPRSGQIALPAAAIIVAQIFNLPYRRVAPGMALKVVAASNFQGPWQTRGLRRLQICDTAECNSAPRRCSLAATSLLYVILFLSAGCAPDKPVEKASAPVAVKLVLPRRGEITRTIALPGNVLPYQQAALYAKVGGYLKTINVDKGDQVAEGATLVEIEVPELLADQSKFKAELDVAEIDYQRTVEAQKKAPDLVVIQSVDAARARDEVARANLERAETLLRFCKIIAPFSGIITKRSVDVGAFIPAATSGSAAPAPALLVVTDFSRVRVQVAVPEPETPFIHNDLPALVTVEELPGAGWPATVTRYTHSLDEATKTMLVEIEVPNPKGQLLPGMYATIKLGAETRTNVLLLPVDALVTEKTGTSVFTVVDGKAAKVPVKTGFNDGAFVEIQSGLPASGPVVLVGKQSLNPGQTVVTTEAK
jgi:membrane fusion protein (multidrug efflux system)